MQVINVFLMKQSINISLRLLARLVEIWILSIPLFKKKLSWINIGQIIPDTNNIGKVLTYTWNNVKMLQWFNCEMLRWCNVGMVILINVITKFWSEVVICFNIIVSKWCNYNWNFPLWVNFDINVVGFLFSMFYTLL